MTEGEGAPAGYVALVRHNPDFRRLWLGNIVSLLGDWFNTIALYRLIDTLTGSPLALGAVFLTKMLPWALASPLAGVLVDRLDRRRVMIASDVVRAVVVLGFLLVDRPEEVYLLYVLTALQVVVGSVFVPAQGASIPNVVASGDLLTASALMSATWSVLLALGAAAGGVVTELLGIHATFVVDSASYLVSAWFIYRTRIPQQTEAPAPGGVVAVAARRIADGWRYIRTHPPIARLAPAKATWSVGGGALVYMLALLGERVSPGAQALGIGLLYAARGVGTGIGPFVARAIFRDSRTWPAVIGAGVVVSGLAYTLLGWSPWSFAVAGFVVLAHAASGMNWSLTSVLLQRRTDDRYRGRVFATEWLLVLSAEAASILVAGLLLETGVMDLRTGFQVFAAVQVVSGIVYFWRVVPPERAASDV